MEKHKQKFFEKYNNLNEKDFRLELLWSQKVTHGKLHKIRKNISRIFWTLIALFIVFVMSVLWLKFNISSTI